MTVLPPTGPADTDLAVAAATAAAEVLPSAEPLVPAGAQPGNEHVTGPFAGAATADLDSPVGARVTILVAADLVEALGQSPIGGLDLAAAVQPAVDAVAATLGTTARAARKVELNLVANGFGGAFTVVPLLGTGFGAAVLVSDAALHPVPAGTEAAAPEPVATTFPPLDPAVPAPGPAVALPVTPLPATRGIEMLHGVDMEVTVELGRTRMTVRDLLALSPGAVLELDRAAGSPADLLVNGRLIARGEVVVVDEDFGLRITEIIEDAAAS